jgi:hypothetical protein
VHLYPILPLQFHHVGPEPPRLQVKHPIVLHLGQTRKPGTSLEYRQSNSKEPNQNFDLLRCTRTLANAGLTESAATSDLSGWPKGEV